MIVGCVFGMRVLGKAVAHALGEARAQAVALLVFIFSASSMPGMVITLAALGAFIGGAVADSRLGLGATPWVGAIMVGVDLLLTLWSGHLDKREVRRSSILVSRPSCESWTDRL